MQRPEAGAQEKFSARKEAKEYRYPSHLDPELGWDQGPVRALAEWLIDLIVQAANSGEENVFVTPQKWKGGDEEFSSLADCVARLQTLTRPYLNWSGKSERRRIFVPTPPLFMHERLSVQAILKSHESQRASGSMDDLFGDSDLSDAERLNAYEHRGPWNNRLVLGDSLQVMNSLLEYEGMSGQAQMIYFDPPYGVKFGSNFQPFVSKRDVTHNSDNDMVREPETVKAYRDTWELGIHSYLTYMRDRLFLAKELLSDTGSIFVQISDDNVHHVRELMDEVFPGGFVSQITFQTTSGFESNKISTLGDFLLWYTKDREDYLYNKIWKDYPIELGKGNATRVYFADGTSRPLNAKEKKGEVSIPKGAQLCSQSNLQSQGPSSEPQPFEFEGELFEPGPNRHWAAHWPAGMERLKKANRLCKTKNNLYYIRLASDFPFKQIGNIWTDTTSMYSDDKIYAVQTPAKVIENCIQMSTNPGDLVLDLTCGSGTTPFVAEKWGRRWIAIDTSRVPLALARQRLLTACFPWFKLDKPAEGPSGGFVYKQKKNNKGEEVGGLVPRVTLKSIANDEEPEVEKIVNRPESDKQTIRVTGAFSVEATVHPAKQIMEESQKTESYEDFFNYRSYLSFMVKQLQLSKRIRMPGNKAIELENVEKVDGCDYIHARAEIANKKGLNSAAFIFGPVDGAISFDLAHSAAAEAIEKKYSQLFLCGMMIQPEARARLKELKIPTEYVAVSPDVVMGDLLKTGRASEVFTITGLPDITLRKDIVDAKGNQLYRVSIEAVDIWHPDTMETEVVEARDLPCWMLDTDYNGMVFRASQVFFPRTEAWNALKKALGSQYEDGLWERLAGTESEAFDLGGYKRVAVKVIDMRGTEMIAIKGIEDLAGNVD